MTHTLDCPDAGRLRSLLDGMLSDRDQDELTGHLDGCPGCQERLEMLAASGWLPAGIAQLGRWRREAGPALAHAITELTRQDCLDTPPAEDEPIFDWLTPSGHRGSLGRFGPHEVLEILGQGGMGVVLKALDPDLNRVVALKVLAPQLAASAAARKRFAREARAAAAIDHANVVRIHAVDSERGLPYLVMEHVEGETLQQRISREGPLELEDVLSLGVQIAEGLAAAHDKGIVHRDLKPGNVLLAACGAAAATAALQAAIPKITDFGLARSLDDGTVTQSGFLPGTPAYMAPEQARGELADARSDLFSLGSILYAMSTGRPPFQASTLFALLRRVGEDDALPVQQLNPLIPNWMAEIMKKLHAKDPAQRFQSASETATVLRECLAHVRQPAQSPLPWFLRGLEPKPASRRRGILAALLLCILLGSGLWAAGVFRVKTPEGTLVVEVSDPKVNVTVDGQDVIISGEGIAETRLRAGQHKLEASKDGKPVLTKLIEIKKDGKEVVRVSLEPPAQPAVSKVTSLTLKGHTGKVQSLTFSPDGRVLASAGKDNAVRLWEAATGKPLVVREKAGPVLAISFFPDGKVLVTVAADGTVQLWDVATGKVLTSVKLPGTIKLSSIDPLSKTLASSSGGWLRVWDLSAGKERVAFPYGEVVQALVLSPDARSLAVAGTTEVTLWDVTSGKERVRVPHRAVRALAFSPDGKRLVGYDDKVRIWDAATGKVLSSILKASHPTATAQSPDGTAIAAGDADGTVVVMSVASGEVLFTYKEKAGPIEALAFSPDGSRLAWAAPEGDIRVAPINAGGKPSDQEQRLKQLQHLLDKVTRELEQARDEATRQRARAEVERARALLEAERAQRAAQEAEMQARLDKSAAERLLYLRNIEMAQRAWEKGQVKDIAGLLEQMPQAQRHWEWHYMKRLASGVDGSRKLEGHTGGVLSVAFSPDGKRIASTGHDLMARVWDAATGKTMIVIQPHLDAVDRIVFSPDGRRFATAGRNGKAAVWDLATAATVLTLTDGETGPASVAFSPDAKLLAWTAGEGRVWAVDAATGKLMYKTMYHGGRGRTVAFSPDGKLLALAGERLHPHLLDAATGKMVRMLTGGDKDYASIAFSPDGKQLAASGLSTGGAWVWDVASGKLLFALRGHTGEVSGIAFSPDGRRLATCGKDGTIRLWDAATGQAVLTLTAHDKGVSSVAFSPDGKLLVSGGLDRTVRIWPPTER